MPHEDCHQIPTIAQLQTTIGSISETLKEMKKGQEKFIEVLEHIASQGERINHLETDMQRNEKDVNNLFGRVRELEMEPGKQGKALWIGAIMSAVSVMISVAIARLFK